MKKVLAVILAVCLLICMHARASESSTLVLPGDLTIICTEAFMGSTELEKVVIPDNVTEIGAEAFRNCASLSIVIAGDNIKTIGENAFSGCAADFCVYADADTDTYNTCMAAGIPVMERPGYTGSNKIGFTCPDGSNSFYVALENAVREVVEAHGDELICVDPQNSNEKQNFLIEDLISQGISAMFISPVDREGITPALETLDEAGIPVIGFDRAFDEDKYLISYVDSDDFNAGYICGLDLVEKCPKGGNIIVLDSPTMQDMVDRTDGFLTAIEGKSFRIVAQLDSMANQKLAYNNCTDALIAYPNVAAIFGCNDATALGAFAAAEAAGSTALIYGVDGSPDMKACIAEGMTTATGAESPITIGKTVAETYYSWAVGEEVEAHIQIDTFLIKADNVAEYGTNGWQ